MAITRPVPPKKSSSVLTFSSGQNPFLPLIVGCLFPLVATALDIARQALPFSLESVVAVQRAQPLHWLIDLVPIAMLLLLSQKRKPPARITTSAPRIQTSPGLAVSSTLDQAAPQQKAITTLKAELASVQSQLAQVRANEAALREMIENAPDAIFTTSVDGTVTSVNRGAEQMLGWTRQEMVGHPLSNLLTLASLPHVETHVAQILTNPSASPICEVEFVHSSGRGLLVEGCTSVIRNSSGEAIGLHTIYRDLSYRQQALARTGEASETLTWQEDTSVVSTSNIPVATALSFEATPSGALKVPGLLSSSEQKTEGTLTNENGELAAVNLTFPIEPETTSQVPPSAPAQFTFIDEATTESQPTPDVLSQFVADDKTLEPEPSSAKSAESVHFAFLNEPEASAQVTPPVQFAFAEAETATEPQPSTSTLLQVAPDETAREFEPSSAERVQFAFLDETEPATQDIPSLPERFSFAEESTAKLQMGSLPAEQFVFIDEMQGKNETSLLSFEAPGDATSSPFNYSEALSYIGGDEMLLAELATIFLQEYPQLLENLRTAVASNDVEALIYHAHALKGSVSNFVALEAENAARRLEQIGRDGDLTEAPKVLSELEAALTRLTPALSTLAVQAAA